MPGKTQFPSSLLIIIYSIHRQDRFYQPQTPRFWQPGVYITAIFSGDYCEVILNDEILWGKNHNYLEVVLDGKAIRLQTKAQRILLK
ncbi:MAG: hypothetical protein WDO16_06755 [Bacteroidota bacterium]